MGTDLNIINALKSELEDDSYFGDFKTHITSQEKAPAAQEFPFITVSPLDKDFTRVGNQHHVRNEPRFAIIAYTELDPEDQEANIIGTATRKGIIEISELLTALFNFSKLGLTPIVYDTEVTFVDWGEALLEIANENAGEWANAAVINITVRYHTDNC